MKLTSSEYSHYPLKRNVQSGNEGKHKALFSFNPKSFNNRSRQHCGRCVGSPVFHFQSVLSSSPFFFSFYYLSARKAGLDANVNRHAVSNFLVYDVRLASENSAAAAALGDLAVLRVIYSNK